MYLLLTQFSLKSASTFPKKRPKKAKEPCIFDQWRSRLMVSFSCVCLCLHSFLGPTFKCTFFSQSASTYPKKANICGGKRPRRLHGCISLSLSLSLSRSLALSLSRSLALSLSLALPPYLSPPLTFIVFFFSLSLCLHISLHLYFSLHLSFSLAPSFPIVFKVLLYIFFLSLFVSV